MKSPRQRTKHEAQKLNRIMTLIFGRFEKCGLSSTAIASILGIKPSRVFSWNPIDSSRGRPRGKRKEKALNTPSKEHFGYLAALSLCEIYELHIVAWAVTVRVQHPGGTLIAALAGLIDANGRIKKDVEHETSRQVDPAPLGVDIFGRRPSPTTQLLYSLLQGKKTQVSTFASPNPDLYFSAGPLSIMFGIWLGSVTGTDVAGLMVDSFNERGELLALSQLTIKALTLDTSGDWDSILVQSAALFQNK